MDTDDKNIREARWNAMIEKWHEKYLEEYPGYGPVPGGVHLQVPEEDRQAAGCWRATAWTAAPEERDPAPGRRGGRAAPGPRLRPLHPRPDPGAFRLHPGHPLRQPEAGHHLGGDGEAVYAPLQLPRLLRGRGQACPFPRPPGDRPRRSGRAGSGARAPLCGGVPLRHPRGV